MKEMPIWWNLFINEYLQNGNNAKQAYMKARPGVSEQAAGRTLADC